MQVGSWTAERGTNLLDSGAPFYDVYETSDGRWMSVGGLEPQFCAAMEQVLNRPCPASVPCLTGTRWPSGRPFARRSPRRSRTKTQAEWTALFDGTDACVAPVVPIA